MQQPLVHILNKQHFWLTTARCIFWQEQNAIIVSDLHFGKTGHFRKHGIAVPQNIFIEDIQRLIEVITHFKAEKVIAVGDLFHSYANKEMDLFLKWRQDFAHIHFDLIKGNHDILKADWYKKASIQIHTNEMVIDNFSFVHDIATCDENNTNYCFSGHIHPGVLIKGISKQSLRFPCFHFAENHAVLPAFSRFTGLANIKANKKDSVFAIVEKTIIKV